MSGASATSGAPVGYIDTTLRDLGPLPSGEALATDDLVAAAAALADVGAQALEVLDARSVRAAIGGRRESPWDRLRAVAREVRDGGVGVVALSRSIWGQQPVAPDVIHQFVVCARESGVTRVRVVDPMNEAASMEPLARAATEVDAALVPTLTLGPAPGLSDDRWVQEAAQMAELPGAVALCVTDLGGFVVPRMVGEVLGRLRAAVSLPIELQVQAPGGIAPLLATEAVAAGVDALHAAAGPIALVAARPSAETLRAALRGGGRELACNREAVDRAANVVGPMLPAERLRQAAAAVYGPALQLPPHLETGLGSRMGRLGRSNELQTAAEEVAEVAADVGGATLAYPIGEAIVAQAIRHVTGEPRFEQIESPLARVALGEFGPARAPVASAVTEAAEAQAPAEHELFPLPAVAADAPEGMSDEDLVLWAQFGSVVQPVLERRRSIGAEAEVADAPAAIDRQLIDTLVDVVEQANQSEISVEVAGARLTVRRTDPVTVAGTPKAPSSDGAAPSDQTGLLPVESPMVGTFYRAPSPDAEAFVEVGQRVEAGQTVCLIEAMKLFNEIVADQPGIVREVLAENEAPVEYGQPLFLIEP